MCVWGGGGVRAGTRAAAVACQRLAVQWHSRSPPRPRAPVSRSPFSVESLPCTTLRPTCMHARACMWSGTGVRRAHLGGAPCRVRQRLPTPHPSHQPTQHTRTRLHRKVAADRPRLGLQRVGGADQLARRLDHARALPHLGRAVGEGSSVVCSPAFARTHPPTHSPTHLHSPPKPPTHPPNPPCRPPGLRGCTPPARGRRACC